MIVLSNGHSFEYIVASGAMGFDGRGWLWERPLVRLGFIKPELFTTVLKTLTWYPRNGNLRWWKPWECIKSIPGGSVNKVSLTNKGIRHWINEIAPNIDFKKFPIVGSVFGDVGKIVELTREFNAFDFVALEVNGSCPNVDDSSEIQQAESIIRCVRMAKSVSRHPVIVKASVSQNYLAIARGLVGVAEAISLNSVPWEVAFHNGEETPLWRLMNKTGGGGGGVSGKPAQKENWKAVKALATQGALPVIAPGIMEFSDMDFVRSIGASAVSFGAIHLPTKGKPWTLFTNPCKPTRYVELERRGER
ncbi:MAG TPA: hypothetical protein ENJ75_02320 [Candidatus Kaiserbacteria bacterium]|nr:hypothetical protein [Candidatus Kaiserbacteria bacterium]